MLSFCTWHLTAYPNMLLAFQIPQKTNFLEIIFPSQTINLVLSEPLNGYVSHSSIQSKIIAVHFKIINLFFLYHKSSQKSLVCYILGQVSLLSLITVELYCLMLCLLNSNANQVWVVEKGCSVINTALTNAKQHFLITACVKNKPHLQSVLSGFVCLCMLSIVIIAWKDILVEQTHLKPHFKFATILFLQF